MDKIKKTHGWKSKRTKHRKFIKYAPESSERKLWAGRAWERKSCVTGASRMCHGSVTGKTGELSWVGNFISWASGSQMSTSCVSKPIQVFFLISVPQNLILAKQGLPLTVRGPKGLRG